MPWTITFSLENYSKYFGDFTCWFSGERSLPFGLLLTKTIQSVSTGIDANVRDKIMSIQELLIQLLIGSSNVEVLDNHPVKNST